MTRSDELFRPFRCSLAAAGLVLLTLALVSAARGGETATADDLMSRAREGRAVWTDFPGFTADVALTRDGRRAAGRVTVSESGDVSLDLADAADAPWAQRKLDSVVGHRLAGDDAAPDVVFADDETDHPLGRLLKLEDDSLHGLFRVQGDVITEVHRATGDTRFTISVTEVSRNPEGKHLPRSYSVSRWDADSGELVSTNAVHDEWTRVGRFDLPARLLTIISAGGGKREVQQIELRNHRLLDAGAADPQASR